MSIYTSMGEFGILDNSNNLRRVFIKGVPPHIKYTGPEWDWLPPPVHGNSLLRAVVFVLEGRIEKGTKRCGQEYVDPLLILPGKEYMDITFVKLLSMLNHVPWLNRPQKPSEIDINIEAEITRRLQERCPHPNDMKCVKTGSYELKVEDHCIWECRLCGATWYGWEP